MHTATIELPLRWQPDLFADRAGTATISVDTDCSMAGFLREVTQG